MAADREFLFEYHFGGATWGTSVFADTEAEAREKIKVVGMARYVGESHGKIPAVPGGSLLAELVCWWKNRSHSQ